MRNEEAKGGKTHGRWRVEGDGEVRGGSGRWRDEGEMKMWKMREWEKESEKDDKMTWTSVSIEIWHGGVLR